MLVLYTINLQQLGQQYHHPPPHRHQVEEVVCRRVQHEQEANKMMSVNGTNLYPGMLARMTSYFVLICTFLTTITY
jgi:hypothetical protein